MYEEIKNEIRATGYTGELDSYNRIELLAILEFGDPRAFKQIEYDFSEGQNVNYSLGTIDKFIRTPKERATISKFKKIMNYLDNLPEKYSAVKKHIRNYDMDRLIVALENYRSTTILRVLIILVKERANEFGVNCDINEFKEIYRITRLNVINSKSILLNANIISNIKKDTLMIQVQNILLQYKEELGDEYMQVLSVCKSFRDKFPDAIKGKLSAVVVTLLSIKLVTGKSSVDLAKSYSENYRPIYQKLYRAEKRDVNYRNELSIVNKDNSINYFD